MEKRITFKKTQQEITSKNILGLQPVNIPDNYRDKWNIIENDFQQLTKNGDLLRPTLYRKGGLNEPDLEKDRYFMLIKHVEAYYPDNITTDVKRKPHLESRWCIIDQNGNERVEFKHFKSPYLIKDSVIYTLEGNFYNVETGYKYGSCANSYIESSNYLFLENRYDKDKSKRGVFKINKKDGSYELYE